MIYLSKYLRILSWNAIDQFELQSKKQHNCTVQKKKNVIMFIFKYLIELILFFYLLFIFLLYFFYLLYNFCNCTFFKICTMLMHL